ncbi:MAG TPA: DNA-processing protein DprA [Candidatus Limnocylindrales bacterium]|nr:DNA-processing protein DprA [Candidatus Limnocylindrales bacterium]
MGREGPVGPPATASSHRAGEGSEAFGDGDRRLPVPAPGPTGDAVALALVASVEGVGPVLLERLLAALGGATGVLETARSADGAAAVREASRDPDGRPGLLSDGAAEALAVIARRPEPFLEAMRHAGVRPLALDDPDYPRRLRLIELPPRVLFVRGAVAALEARHAVAVVGTRRPTDPGRRTAARIGAALARADALVVSGLAVGIDGAAHAAVVAEGGPTVAVIGSGHARLFPRSHDRLADAIVHGGGAVISEHPPGTRPTRGTFPRRNRVISGLADAVVVVEAGATSGALLTAAWALEQGRECFLVPGSIDAPQSAGCLAWLRDYAGVARIVSGVPQLLEDLGLEAASAFPEPRRAGTLVPPPVPVRAPSAEARQAELPPREARIARQLIHGAGTADELVATTGLPIAAVLAGLTALETRGLAVGAYGRYRPSGALAGATPAADDPAA